MDRISPIDAVPPRPLTRGDLSRFLRSMRSVYPDLTQERLAGLAYVSQATVSRLENGRDVMYSRAVRILTTLIEYYEDNIVPRDHPIQRIASRPVESGWATHEAGETLERMRSKEYTHMPYGRRGEGYVGLVRQDKLSEALAGELASDAELREAEDRVLVLGRDLPDRLAREAPDRPVPPPEVIPGRGIGDAWRKFLREGELPLIVRGSGGRKSIVTRYDFLFRVRDLPEDPLMV